jgi:hypothetical protein
MTRLLAQQIQLPGSDPTKPVKVTGLQNFKFSDIGDILNDAIPLLFAIAGIGLLLMILSAGFTLMTSAGDAKKMQAGTQRLTFAVVGFLIIFAAYWGVQLTGKMFGITEFGIFQ